MRVKTGSVRRKRHKKILKRAKGFYSSNSRCFTVAIEKSDRALAYQYRDRRRLKREQQKLWNQRINAGARLNGVTYSTLMAFLKKANIQLNRKMLADIALWDADGFSHLVKKAVSQGGVGGVAQASTSSVKKGAALKASSQRTGIEKARQT